MKAEALSQGLVTHPRLPAKLLGAGILLGVSWTLMWSQDTFWNPLFFLGLWSGATLLMYGAGWTGYPGLWRHALLAVMSVPVWWWFELVNERVGNWEYIGGHEYTTVEYYLLASLSFSTVVPALHSAFSMTVGRSSPQRLFPTPVHRAGYVAEALSGLTTVALVFGFPDLFFPLVWVGPFLVLDGIVGYDGGRSLAREMLRGRWRLAAAIALGGLICGFLWELWNFWATPKWIYHVQYLDYIHVFEMPLLGYLGYIPFAWSIFQLLSLRPLRRLLESHPRTPHAQEMAQQTG